jgi:hypothetical protein
MKMESFVGLKTNSNATAITECLELMSTLTRWIAEQESPESSMSAVEVREQVTQVYNKFIEKTVPRNANKFPDGIDLLIQGLDVHPSWALHKMADYYQKHEIHLWLLTCTLSIATVRQIFARKLTAENKQFLACMDLFEGFILVMIKQLTSYDTQRTYFINESDLQSTIINDRDREIVDLKDNRDCLYDRISGFENEIEHLQTLLSDSENAGCSIADSLDCIRGMLSKEQKYWEEKLINYQLYGGSFNEPENTEAYYLTEVNNMLRDLYNEAEKAVLG